MLHLQVWPVNLPERVYLLIFMFAAFSLFAVVISRITTMFNKLEAKKAAFQVRCPSRGTVGRRYYGTGPTAPRYHAPSAPESHGIPPVKQCHGHSPTAP